MADQNEADILRILEESDGSRSAEESTLRSIDSHMEELLDMMKDMSQSAVFDKQSKKDRSVFSDRYRDGSFRSTFRGAEYGIKGGIQKAIADAMGVGRMKDSLNKAFREIAGDIGVSVEQLPDLIGQEIGKTLISKLPKKLTQTIQSKTKDLEDQLIGSLTGTYRKGRDAAHQQNVDKGLYRALNKTSVAPEMDTINVPQTKPHMQYEMETIYAPGSQGSDDGAAEAMKAVGSLAKMGRSAESAASGVESAGAAMEAAGVSGEAGALLASEGMAGLAGSVEALAPIITAAGPAIIGVVAALAILGPALEGTKKLVGSLGDALGRSRKSIQVGTEQATDRMKKDVETLVKTPFEIMNKAAEEWYSTWDNNLRTITATQGYNKAQLQDLMASFAERLRADGLTDVVSATDLTSNLKSVLEQGLSGQVAEEFAYIATILNSAIPTQDFFGYAGTYASIAANAIKNGKSEADAIAEANAQLTSFANNLLFASREVAGGFTTGLKNAESLFSQATQIALAGRSGNASAISGVLTAVSAITGAIAPDLASAMTDAIYKAAVGGNSPEIVALRSLAGINASNTEFLRQISQNPKEIFSTLFRELANRQSMSDAAYMEVAEGLSSVFGISADAFARVDFAYLADAIANMNTSSDALVDNLSLLRSGETTTTAEQLKMREINKQILDEGLSYVLDNEAARAIQQHVWDEQLARQMQETTYAVEIKGAMLQFIEGISHSIETIVTIINPLMWASKIEDISTTVEETRALEEDINKVLELGKVGSGNDYAKYLLTTRNQDLNVTDNLVSLLGGSSSFASAEAERLAKRQRSMLPYSRSIATGAVIASLLGMYDAKTQSDFERPAALNQSSLYSFGILGKSQAPSSIPSGRSSATAMSALVADTVKAQKHTSQRIDDMIASMDSFVQSSPTASYDEWIKTSRQYGVSDFNAALEDAGLTGETVKGRFDLLHAQIAGQQEGIRRQTEEQFWVDSKTLAQEQLTYQTSIYETEVAMQEQIGMQMETIISHTEYLLGIYESGVKMNEAFAAFMDQWTEYFVNHSVYKSAYNSSEVERIARAEKNESQTAVLALAEALTKNDVNLLVDPTLQTNALLSAILQTATAILNATNAPREGNELANSIIGLSLGL